MNRKFMKDGLGPFVLPVHLQLITGDEEKGKLQLVIVNEPPVTQGELEP